MLEDICAYARCRNFTYGNKFSDIFSFDGMSSKYIIICNSFDRFCIVLNSTDWCFFCCFFKLLFDSFCDFLIDRPFKIDCKHFWSKNLQAWPFQQLWNHPNQPPTGQEVACTQCRLLPGARKSNCCRTDMNPNLYNLRKRYKCLWIRRRKCTEIKMSQIGRLDYSSDSKHNEDLFSHLLPDRNTCISWSSILS